MNLKRILDALRDVRDTSWDYYDGDNVWCRFCYENRPSPAQEFDLDWHSTNCIYRIAREEFLDEDEKEESEPKSSRRFKTIRHPDDN